MSKTDNKQNVKTTPESRSVDDSSIEPSTEQVPGVSEATIYERFKELLISKDSKYDSDSNEPYTQIPYVLTNRGMTQDKSFFVILASRAMTTREISTLIKTSGPCLIFSDQPTYFHTCSDAFGICTSEIEPPEVICNLRIMNRINDAESSKSTTCCGQCTGQKELAIGIDNELTIGNSILLETTEFSPDEKKTWISRFNRTYKMNCVRSYTRVSKPYPMNPGSVPSCKEFKIYLKAYEISSQYENGPEDMTMILMSGMNNGDILKCFGDGHDGMRNENRLPKYYKDATRSFKMFVGNMKYANMRKSREEELRARSFELRQKQMKLAKLKNSYESLNIGADRKFGDVKKRLESTANDDLSRYYGNEEYTSSTSINTYTHRIADKDMIVFTTLHISSHTTVKSAMRSAPPSKSKTLSVVTNSYSIGEKDVSTLLVTNPKYDYQKIVEAYDRYLEFQEFHQCKSCRYVIGYDINLDISATAQFVKDSETVENGILSMSTHGNNDSKKIANPNFRSFIHSLATKDGRYQRTSANSLLYAAEIPNADKSDEYPHIYDVSDILMILTTEREGKLWKRLDRQIALQEHRHFEEDQETKYARLHKVLKEKLVKEEQEKQEEERREAELKKEKDQEEEQKRIREAEQEKKGSDAIGEYDKEEDDGDDENGELIILSYGSSEQKVRVVQYEQEGVEEDDDEQNRNILIISWGSSDSVIQVFEYEDEEADKIEGGFVVEGETKEVIIEESPKEASEVVELEETEKELSKVEPYEATADEADTSEIFTQEEKVESDDEDGEAADSNTGYAADTDVSGDEDSDNEEEDSDSHNECHRSVDREHSDDQETFLVPIPTQVQFDAGALFAYAISSEYFEHIESHMHKETRKVSITSEEEKKQRERESRLKRQKLN